MQAHGHGSIIRPPARNVLAHDDTCPQCLNAGTTEAVSAKKTLKWPQGRHGLCGDAYEDSVPRDHEAGGAFYKRGLFTSYVQGQVIDIDILTTTNHNGKFGFRICKVSGGYDGAEENEKTELTEECFDQHILQQANVAGAQSPGQRWFYTTPGDPEITTYNLHYQLPEDLVCDGESSHCVLQWYWLTLQSCGFSDIPEKYVRKDATYLDCSVEGSPYPEEFWNCADIVIQKPGATPNSDVLSDGQSIKNVPWNHPSLKQYMEQNR